MRQPNPIVELASGEYDRRKMNNPGVQVALFPVARLFNIPPKKLVNFRANYVSRKKKR